MSRWRVVFTKQAQKDAQKLAAAGLRSKTKLLIGVLKQDPFRNPPPYEKLVGDLAGFYSRRINIQHRLVYQVFVEERVVKVVRLWTHDERPPQRQHAAAPGQIDADTGHLRSHQARFDPEEAGGQS